MRVRFRVNDRSVEIEVEARRLLVQALREDLGLTGTKVGCETTTCGSCTVLFDGEPVKSCTVLAVQAQDAEVTTIEGVSPGASLSPVQEAFKREHGLQCGFCTPGMVMSVVALLERCPSPDEEAIKEALEGNICRCTGYVGIRRAVRHAAGLLRGESPPIEAGRNVEEPLARHAVGSIDIGGDDDIEVV